MRTLFELNLYSPIRTIQIFLPLLRASTNSPTIINHSSSAALTPIASMAWLSAYNASKAAYSSMIETMKHEFYPFGIRIVELRTGNVKSNFFNNLEAQEAMRPRLPEESVYEAAREEIELVMQGKMMEEKGIEREVYARRVVKDLNNGVETIYRGSMASVAKWSYGFQQLFPRWLLNYLIRDIGMVFAVDRKLKAAKAAEQKL